MPRPSGLKTRPKRLGFTLVELLVVIVIIGILVALLVPTVIAAVRKARDAQVSAEIQILSQALVQFKDRYGEFPPSRVILNESGIYTTGSTTAGQINGPVAADYQVTLDSSAITYYNNAPIIGTSDISFGTLAERSLRALRRYFPKASPPSGTFFHDFNGNGTLDSGFIYLDGSECLAFFLGGIPSPTQDPSGAISFGMAGFGKNVAAPFSNPGLNAASLPASMISTNRTQPFFEFKSAQLVDFDGDGIPSYVDQLGTQSDARPYAYFVSYGAAGYDPNDMNVGEDPDGNGVASAIAFRVGTPVYNGKALSNTTVSPAPNPYTSSLPVPVNGGAFDGTQPASYLNNNSYQIISAGGDRLYGPGGQFSNGSGDKLPIPPASAYTSDYTELRQREKDNVGNFTQGRLD